MDASDIKTMVRERYGNIATSGPASCGEPATSCCAPSERVDVQDKARRMGYSDAELAAIPNGANLGLDCGNPQAIAALRPGETVVDLGSGAGFDCFLAARQVGPDGHLIGVDMTHETLAKARDNAGRSCCMRPREFSPISAAAGLPREGPEARLWGAVLTAIPIGLAVMLGNLPIERPDLIVTTGS